MSPPIEINAIPPAAAAPAVGPVVGQVAVGQHDAKETKTPPVPQERAPAKPEAVKAEAGMVHLGYTVDHEANALKIKVTNQVSGEVVREFELKGLGSAHHEPINTKGLVVDDRT